MGGSRRARARAGRVTAALILTFLATTLVGVAHAAPPVGGFLNPDTDGPFSVISDTPDGTESTYHFVLRVDPADVGQTITTVEIQTEDGDLDALWETIGNATQVGSSDAWEFRWDVSAYPGPGEVNNDDGFVRAQVFDSGGEASLIPSAAGIPVRFQDATADTIEITSSSNLGFFDGPDADTEPEALVSGTGSIDITSTGEVDLFYSTSPATASDPAWTACGEADATTANTWRGICELAPGVAPTDVTAAAARADDTDDDAATAFTDSGDAHRVSGYVQTATGATVQITPANTSSVVGICPTQTVVVRDSLGNVIVGANVDVHATGPADEQIQFAWNMDDPDTATDQVSDNGPNTHAPSAPGAVGHATYEPMAECDGTVSADGTFTETTDDDPDFPPPIDDADNKDADDASDGTPSVDERGSQARHLAVGADPKHLEGFTDADGFEFSLDSASTGTTSILAWFDPEAPDDEDPTGNPQATGSVSWAPTTVDATPESDTNNLGTSHTVTVAVTQGGVPKPNQTVQFRVTAGPHADNDLDGDPSTPAGVFGPCVTDANGQCSDSYTGTEGGTDTIQVWIDADGDSLVDPDEASDPGGVQKTWGAVVAVGAAPDTATNNTGTSHTITATVTESGSPKPNQVVQFRVISGPHADNDLDANGLTPGGVFGPCTTGSNGQCTDAYTGIEGGTDSINVWTDNDGDFLVDPDEPSDLVQKTWILATTVVAAPQSAINKPGTSHTITATVQEGTTPKANQTVRFRVTSGPHSDNDLDANAATPAGVIGDCTTGSNGTCSRSYTGTELGTDTIQVWIDSDGDFLIDTGEPAEDGGVRKVWAAQTALQCSPQTDVNRVDTSHSVTAVVTDGAGNAIAGVNVDFQVRVGPHADNDLDANGTTPPGYFGEGATNAQGQISKSYTGIDVTPNDGKDVIDCWIDANDNDQDDGDTMEGDGADTGTTVDAAEQVDSGDLSDYLDKLWTPAGACPGFEGDPRNQVVGTSGDDSLTGTSQADVICGLGGADRIFGLDGNDLLLGGAGSDALDGGAGDDVAVGGEGNDRVWGRAGSDVVFGQAGDDVLRGNDGGDRISGGGDDDVIDLGSGDDRGWGGAGRDKIYGLGGTDVIYGNTDHDLRLDGGAGNDSLVGGEGNDVIVGGTGRDRMWGQDGRDRLFSADGVRDLTVNGGPGVDGCSIDRVDPVSNCP